MKKREKIISIILAVLSIISIGVNTYAHSGRTDANGGHKDNKNKSGLGSYHYHCGGHPAHLHTNGICPYSSNKNNTSSSSSANAKEATTTPTTIEITKLEIQEDIENLEVGETKVLTVTITPSNATNKDITWKSSDESIAVITSEGELIAKKAGTVEITATCSNGKTSTIEIRVKDVPETENNVVNNYTHNNIINNEEDAVASSKEDSNPLGTIVALSLIGVGGYLGYKSYKKSK